MRAVLLPAVLLAALGLATSAEAATIAPLDPSAPPLTGKPRAPFRDRVLTRPRARAASFTVVYRTSSDGTPIQVEFSNSFADTPDNRAAGQQYVDYLGSLVHGAELGRLRVFIGTRREVSALCGGGPEVLACYAISQNLMYVPSEEPQGGPYTRAYALAHEFGHHIERWRSNAPFPALFYGAKYWASYEHVCSLVHRGSLAAGDPNRYTDDPGEGFADSYAHMQNGFRNVRWQFSPLMRPDDGAFAAIRRDVLTPWSRSASRTFRGSLTGRRHSASSTFRVSLDGDLSLKLSGPARANFDLELINGSRVVVRTRARGSRDGYSGLFCRSSGQTASLRVRVRRISGAGSFSVRVTYAG